ncbi:MAG: hypothetical protein LBT92_02985, partial [Rickettsiales bacterium]|nr:hypothetical protein [Rickettsiales bacterium]
MLERKLTYIFASAMIFTTGARADDAADIRENYRISREAATSACGAISKPMGDIALFAGISTVSSAVGTLAAGAATVTGIMKASNDKKLEKDREALRARLAELNATDAQDLLAALDSGELEKIIESMKSDLGDNPAVHDAQTNELEQKVIKGQKTSASFGTARAVGSFVAGGTSAVASGTAFAGAFAVDYDK